MRTVVLLLIAALIATTATAQTCTEVELDDGYAALALAQNGMQRALNMLEAQSMSDVTIDLLSKWFGVVASNGLEVVRETLSASLAFSDGATFNCLRHTDAAIGDVYAYVYADDPFVIAVAIPFFEAPTSGFDSQMGILVHELTHFRLTGDTGDHDFRYGIDAALERARTSPEAALRTADNYMYFVEEIAGLPD